MITFCIPSKNNLRYLKACIPSIQSNSHYNNNILVFVDQDIDGTVEWLKANNITYILNQEKECKGIGYAYDTMFKASTTDLVVAFHADMILGPDADKYLVQEHKRGSVVCATRIEPPLHPPGPEKIVKDFGMWPEDIKWEEFNKFVKTESKANENRLGKTSFAPWLIDRRDHLGHDPIFLSVFEDADLFRRFVLAGYKMLQSWSSLVYHLTCRGGQFAGAEKLEDFQKKDEKWMYNNQVSMMEYIRKWGGFFKEYGPCEPKPNRKYSLGLEVEGENQDLLVYEPFFDQINTTVDPASYIQVTQPLSSFDIKAKFVTTLTTDIIIKYKYSVDTLQEFSYIINNIEDLLEEAESSTSYEIGPAILEIKKKQVTSPKLKVWEYPL
jgi:glycosyltransferase involved in cell wall biosynthesis